MKKIASCFTVVMVVFIFFLFSMRPAPVQANVDSERAAQVFAGLSFDRCVGGFNFDRWDKGDFLEPVYGNFTFIPSQRLITFLRIYDQVIVDENGTPLKGLPINEKGEARGYSVWLSCYDSNNEYQAHGNFFKEVLWPEDVIVVLLQPDEQQVLVPYTVPAGVAEKNLKMVFNSNSPDGEWEADYCTDYRYCPESGGFSFWVNPLETTKYEVKDVSTGVVYSTGVIDPLAGNPVTEDQSIPINLQFPGGITKVQFEQNQDYDWEYFTNQKLDGQVTEETVPAKVYFMDLEGESLIIYADGFTEGNVEIRRWVSTGEMPVVATGDLIGNRWGTSIDVMSGYGKVVVIVTGVLENSEDGFYISFSRQPANTSGGGMGGGKG